MAQINHGQGQPSPPRQVRRPTDDQPPSYARDLWDAHGLRVISERIKRDEKSMKSLQNYFQDIANLAFRSGTTLHKIATYNVSESEFGTIKFAEDRYIELLETMSKNEEILGSKIRTQCQGKLHDEMARLAKINTKLTSDLSGWHRSLDREKKKLAAAKQKYDDKKKQVLSVERLLTTEKERLHKLKENNVADKIPSIENNIITFQSKLKQVRAQSREQLDLYTKAVSFFRGFRLKFDNQTSSILDGLESAERDRQILIHQCLRTHLEIQQVMVKQSLRNIETIQKHIANIEPEKDTRQFVVQNRSNKVRPPLPEPKFHPDDEDRFHSDRKIDNADEESDEVLHWSEQWRLIVGKILGRDIESSNTTDVISNDPNDPEHKSDSSIDTRPKSTFIELTDKEFESLKTKCIASLDTPAGRLAFALILNRQRNSEYGLELAKEQFFPMVDLVNTFLDAVDRNDPVDVKAAKLVMIMTQSLYVRKGLVVDMLTEQERKDFVEETFHTNVTVNNPNDTSADSSNQSNPSDPSDPSVTGNDDTKDNNDTDTIDPNNNNNNNNNNPDDNNETANNDENIEDDDNNNNNNVDSTPSLVSHARNASYLPKKNKLFVVDRIKGHNLWKSEKFWKEAFVDSVQQEIRKYPMIRRWHAEQEQIEGQRRNQQIVFSQLAAYSHNMKEFGMEDSVIVAFLESQNLPKDQIEMLKMTLQVMNVQAAASPRYNNDNNIQTNNGQYFGQDIGNNNENNNDIMDNNNGSSSQLGADASDADLMSNSKSPSSSQAELP